MEEDENKNNIEEQQNKSKLYKNILITAGLLLSICLYILGSQNERYNTTLLLQKIYLEERCLNDIDYTVSCAKPNIGFKDVFNVSQRTNILDKELTNRCSKGSFVTCVLK